MSRSLVLPFPIRPRFDAQIVVPIDMSKSEAERLCAFVMSLAQPQPPLAEIRSGTATTTKDTP